MKSPIDQTSSSIKKGSKSFSLAALFLPRPARPAVYALYSWCRACDDAVDLTEPIGLESASTRRKAPDLQQLKSWALNDPLIRSLLKNQLCLESHFDEMINGMRMDLQHQGYQSLDELEVYCFRVAGVVGLMMCPLIGVRERCALDHAIALGIAMQLTNICRDVFEDALRGRVYLPLADLGFENHFLAAQILIKNPELAMAVVKKLLARADELYSHGRRGFAYIPFRACFAIALAARVYQLIGHRLLTAASADASLAFRNRSIVPWYQKAWAFLDAVIWTLKSRLTAHKKGSIIFPRWSSSTMEASNQQWL